MCYRYADIKADLALNFAFIYMLFCMLYNYLNRFLATPYFKRYVRRLAQGQPSQQHLSEAVNAQAYLDDTIKTVKSTLTPECRRILNFYRANWQIAE